MPAPALAYRFGPFTLDLGAYRLLRNDAPIALSPKLVDLLRYLVERPATLAEKQELFDAIWPDVTVTDNALTQAVSELRQALGDDPASPTYIHTVARRGYRFIAPVASVDRTTGPEDRRLAARALAEAALPHQAGVVSRASATPTARPRSIAVTDFVNATGDAEFAWLSAGIAETVTNDLRALGDLTVIDRARVGESARWSDGSLVSLGRDLGVEFMVVGSYQRAGDHLRITARIVQAATGETEADAKADGLLTDVFRLQDQLVTQFSTELGLPVSASAAARIGVRETSSLDAYRAFTEGRLRLEALDGAQVPAAIHDFERAIALDPRYALAHVGLANASFLVYEMTRARSQPDAGLLATAIGHARHAIELDRDLAEAHATLAFLLVSADRSEEALAAARRAVALEPQNWRHQFRLGHAAWGNERLGALTRALDLYPDFPFAHFEVAMVHIARSDLNEAEAVLRQGVGILDRQTERGGRFPAKGLHWLLGMIRLARRDAEEALLAFDREIGSDPNQLYAREFAMNASDARGFVLLGRGDLAGAAAMFRGALDAYPDHARSRLGLALTLRVQNARAEAAAELVRARAAILELRRGGRVAEAALAAAFDQVVEGREPEAIETLQRLLDTAGPGFAGWSIPIEPGFETLRPHPGFRAVVARLAERAR